MPPTLADALGSRPNVKAPVRCHVVADSAVQSYQSNNQAVLYKTVRLAEGNTAVKATIYQMHFGRFVEGNYIAFSNYSVNIGAMSIRSSARVHTKDNNLPVTDDARQRAHRIVFPASTTVQIGDIPSLSPGTLFSVIGTVTNVSTQYYL